MLFVKMLKISKKKTVFFKEQNFVKENQKSFGIFKFSTWNHQNQINHSIDMRKSGPCTMYYCIYGKCKHEICLEGATTTFLQLFLGQNVIWMRVPWPSTKYTIKGKVVASPKSGPW
jgi:hypothetical protein